MRSQAYGFEGYSCSEHSTRYPVKERDIVDGAQRYLRRRLQQDPLAEKYYNLSPYAYCANNPVNFVNPDGRRWYDALIGYAIGTMTNIVPMTGRKSTSMQL